MRTSFIALAALAAIGAGAYGGLNDLLPSPVQGAFDKVAAAAGRSGSSAVAKPVQAEATGVAVEAVAAKPETVSARFAAVGSLVSEESVQLAAEQPGRLVSINFTDGDRVAANAPVLKFDDTLLMAELQDLEARLALAEANYKRAQSLSKSGYATDTARDQAIADRAIAKAAVELVKVRLGKTEIRAPFEGVVGFRLASIGAYVPAGQPIVNLESIDTLKVDFRVPETRLADVKIGLGVSVSVDAYPGRTFEGKIYAIDPLVDVNGRALKVRARLDNGERLLRPGLFARIDVTADETQSVVVIPESALVPRGSENIVYRVRDGKAVETPVRLGERRVGEVEIVDGVASDEMVVVAGQQRLRDGSAVRVVDPARQAAAAPVKAAR
ncbi:membrane fusion protein (multidrug efflux system) [Methylopila capsulata]|uniref:Membrane fusion protein (Multidrug efflux system) n=1 Tax=Methylopila capsulata TaxID=61654 RepID=A0A9W6IS20_9HYPH|nr:efflux RND transporter periplasmic adaptor subunit [Methylopila capsulata]MBM7850195.1 membrane fusion protein (multidrug efflux system) [Methylopila capsulata]GLK55487.1 MexH family multidrug efflux RND transporter periplasmic adaptor subunit [Methylopila capsulata]